MILFDDLESIIHFMYKNLLGQQQL